MKRANKTIFQGHFCTNVLIYISVTRDRPIFTQIFYVEDIFSKSVANFHLGQQILNC